MGIRRRHPVSRFIALLTAAVMPLCCCIVSTAAGTSCCTSVEIVQAPSCCTTSCCQEAAPEEPVNQSCDDSLCSCCLKAPASATNWTPPVDTIGTTLMTAEMTPDDLLPSFKRTAALHGHHPPPQPEDSGPVRGQTILQV